jgi:hypothetical protein
MLPWKRFRLLACLAAMLLMLGFGGFALVRWGVTEAPYGTYGTGSWMIDADGFGVREIKKPDPPNPFVRLQREGWRPAVNNPNVW